MAKIKSSIFATTALVAFAGAAAADVSLSGSAEMGIVGGKTTVDGVSATAPTQFLQSVDVRFSMSGASDNGLSFGAVVDLDDATERTGALGDTTGAFADFNVFISGEFGRLIMGDTDGALDFVLTEVGAVGSIADDETGHAGYNGNAGLDGFYNGQVLRYDYAIDGLRFALSAEIDNDGNTDVASATTTVARQYDDAVIGLGVAYSMDLGTGEFGVGAGYQTADDAEVWGASVNYSTNGLTFGLSAMQWTDTPVRIANAGQSNAGQLGFVEGATPTSNLGGATAANTTLYQVDVEHIGVGVTYEFDAFAVHANYGQYEYVSTTASANAANYDASGFGLAASYDLGGGAAVHLGYSNSERSGTLSGTAFNNEYETFSLGLAMSF